MLTDMVWRPTPAGRFMLRAVVGGLSCVGLLRLPWTEAQIVWPLTRIQVGLAVTLLGTPAVPVEATLAAAGPTWSACAWGPFSPTRAVAHAPDGRRRP